MPHVRTERTAREPRPRFRDDAHEQAWTVDSWTDGPDGERLVRLHSGPFALNPDAVARIEGTFRAVLEAGPDVTFPMGARARLACCERVVTGQEDRGKRSRITDWVLWEREVPLDLVPTLDGGARASVEIPLADPDGMARPVSLRRDEALPARVGARGIAWYLDVTTGGLRVARFPVPVIAADDREGGRAAVAQPSEYDVEDVEVFSLDDGAPRLDLSLVARRTPLHALAQAGMTLRRFEDELTVETGKNNLVALFPLCVLGLIGLVLLGPWLFLLAVLAPLLYAMAHVVFWRSMVYVDAEGIVSGSRMLKQTSHHEYRWDDVERLALLSADGGEQHLLCVRLKPNGAGDSEAPDMTSLLTRSPYADRNVSPEGFHAVFHPLESETLARWLYHQFAAFSPFAKDADVPAEACEEGAAGYRSPRRLRQR